MLYKLIIDNKIREFITLLSLFVLYSSRDMFNYFSSTVYLFHSILQIKYKTKNIILNSYIFIVDF